MLEINRRLTRHKLQQSVRFQPSGNPPGAGGFAFLAGVISIFLRSGLSSVHSSKRLDSPWLKNQTPEEGSSPGKVDCGNCQGDTDGQGNIFLIYTHLDTCDCDYHGIW